MQLNNYIIYQLRRNKTMPCGTGSKGGFKGGSKGGKKGGRKGK